MNRRKRISVLWIEDGITSELPNLVMPFYGSQKYEFVPCEDASFAHRLLGERAFEVIIFDLRLTPGSITDYIDCYQNLGRNYRPKRLGLYMLLSLFGGCDTLPIERPEWLTPNMVGVFSVDSWEDVEGELMSIGITQEVFMQKRAGMPHTTLIALVERVLVAND